MSSPTSSSASGSQSSTSGSQPSTPLTPNLNRARLTKTGTNAVETIKNFVNVNPGHGVFFTQYEQKSKYPETFWVTYAMGERPIGQGECKLSKPAAKQDAAERALATLISEGYEFDPYTDAKAQARAGHGN